MATTKSEWVLSELGAVRRGKASSAFWADKPISQMLNTAHRNKQFCEVNTNFAPNSEASKMMNEWMNEKRAAECSVPTVLRDDSNARSYEIISSMLTKQSFGACCWAELQERQGYFVPFSGSVVFSLRNEAPQGSIELRPLILGELALVVLIHIREQLFCSHVSKWTETTEKRPLVSEHKAYKHNNFLKFLNLIYFFPYF